MVKKLVDNVHFLRSIFIFLSQNNQIFRRKSPTFRVRFSCFCVILILLRSPFHSVVSLSLHFPHLAALQFSFVAVIFPLFDWVIFAVHSFIFHTFSVSLPSQSRPRFVRSISSEFFNLSNCNPKKQKKRKCVATSQWFLSFLERLLKVSVFVWVPRVPDFPQIFSIYKKRNFRLVCFPNWPNSGFTTENSVWNNRPPNQSCLLLHPILLVFVIAKLVSQKKNTHTQIQKSAP